MNEEYRICWIDTETGKSGHGEFGYGNQEICDRANIEFPYIHHWIEPLIVKEKL